MYARFSLALIFVMQTCFVPYVHADSAGDGSSCPSWLKNVCLQKYCDDSNTDIDGDTKAKAMELIKDRHSPSDGSDPQPLDRQYCNDLPGLIDANTEGGCKTCADNAGSLTTQSFDNSGLDRQRNRDREEAAADGGDGGSDSSYDGGDDYRPRRHKSSFMSSIGDFFQSPMGILTAVGVAGFVGYFIGKNSSHQNEDRGYGGNGFYPNPRAFPAIMPPRFGGGAGGGQTCGGSPGGYPGYCQPSLGYGGGGYGSGGGFGYSAPLSGAYNGNVYNGSTPANGYVFPTIH